MTQTPKTVEKRVAVVLAILCVAMVVALNVSIITFYSITSSKNDQIKSLNSQIADIQTQVANITSPAPRLISIGMHYSDNRTDQNAPFLTVIGYVCNVGTGTANNCAVHVIAIQNGNGTAIDKFIAINSIEAGTFREIDAQIPYNGQPLMAYSANLEWTP
jgi:hypothetical protein